MPTNSLRCSAVALTAVSQVLAAPLTTVLLGERANTGAISDANVSPVTPAGYAFAIWGLIYLGSLALAVYQLLPSQRNRQLHRRTGWWLAAGFAMSTLWVPVFGTRTIWLSQLIILVLVGCLAVAAARLTAAGPASSTAERLLLRLPVTCYLGWATLAAAAGFATTFRSLGMPERAGWVSIVSSVLVLVATAISVYVVTRQTAAAGFAFAACWALAAVAVGTDEPPIRWLTVAALLVVLGALVLRTVRSRQGATVLLG
jgi:hypothetical protein